MPHRVLATSFQFKSLQVGQITNRMVRVVKGVFVVIAIIWDPIWRLVVFMVGGKRVPGYQSMPCKVADPA